MIQIAPPSLRDHIRGVEDCVHGHAFTAENTIIRKADGTRHCRACKRLQDRAYKARRRKRVT